MTRKTPHRHLRGGAPKLPLNPSPLDGGNIKFLDPSPLLNRNVPYTPPRPGAPSPPPPLGMTSGPAFGLKVNGPPLLAGGKRRKRRSKKRKCKCSGKGIPLVLFGGKKYGGGNFHFPNPIGNLSFDSNPFNNQSDSSTGNVSSEQAIADKRDGAFSSSQHTSELHAETVLGGKRRKSKKFKKHYMWNTKGKRYLAKTHKQHLRGVRKGHTHKKPKRR